MASCRRLPRLVGSSALFYIGGLATSTAATSELFSPAPLRVGSAVMDPWACSGTQEEWGLGSVINPGQAADGEQHKAAGSSSSQACIDGRWSGWGPWQPCSSSCGAGLQLRHRRVEVETTACGQPLVGSEHEFRQCMGDAEQELGPGLSKFLAPAMKPTPCSFQQTQEVCTLSPWIDWQPCGDTGDACDQRVLVRRRHMVLRTKASMLENQVSALQDELKASRKASAALLQQRDKLIEQVANINTAHTSPTSTNRDEHSSSHEAILQHQIDLLKAQTVALKTANLAMSSEGENMRSTAERLRLAFPMACGLISALAVAAFLFVSMCMRRKSYKLHPQREDSENLPDRARHGLHDDSPVCALLPDQHTVQQRGEITWNMSDDVRDPSAPSSPSARGTLLKSMSSPKNSNTGYNL